MLQLRLLAGAPWWSQLDAAQDLAQHDTHLDGRERRSQAAPIAPAERQTRRRAQRRAEHAIRIEATRLRIQVGGRHAPADAGTTMTPAGSR